jgi:hypothetical protein
VGLQRAGGYDVAIVDIHCTSVPRYAVKIPQDPEVA